MYSVVAHRVSLTTKELKALPPHVGGYFVLSSFAIDEIAQLHKLLIAAFANGISEDPLTNAMVIVQHDAIMRNLTAKLFEYDLAVRDLAKRVDMSVEIDLAKFLSSFRSDLRKLRKGLGYKIAEHIRNKFTAHFSMDEAISALELRDQNDVHTMILDTMQGNSYYPVGEEILFLPTFASKRLGTDKLTLTEATDVWRGWIYDTSETFQRFHQKFVLLVHSMYFPDKGYDTVFVRLDKKKQVGTLGKTALPLWWRKGP